MTLAQAPTHRSAGSALGALVTCAVLLSGCSAGTGFEVAPAAPGAASSAPSSAPEEGHRLEFVIPSGWEEVEDPTSLSSAAEEIEGIEEIEDSRVVLGPVAGNARPSLVTATLESSQPLDGIMDDIWGGFPGVEPGDTEQVEVAGREAARSTAVGSVNGVGVTSVTVVVDDGPVRHSLTMTSPDSVAASATAEFEDLLDSVTLDEPLR